MDNFKKWQNELTAKRMIEILEKNGYNTLYADNIAVARQQVLNLLPENATIGLGGSVTLEEMEILEELRSKKYRLIERYKCPVSEHVKVYREALIADFFLTSVNAVTELGELVVTDCSGNRAAALIFGPERVIVAVGANKFVRNLDEAFERIRKIAPLNSKRVGHKTPCTVTGKCEYCDVPQNMCNFTGIVHNGRKYLGKYTIIVIADEAGF